MDKQLADWLQTLELAQVAVTATIDPSGRLGAVGGLWPKLLAGAKEAATLGLLRIIVVAAEQPDIAPELLAPEAAPLRIIQAPTLQEAVARLYEEHGPRAALRQYELERNCRLELLGRTVSIEAHYQVLPLLREVKRERLPREKIGRLEDQELGKERAEKLGLHEVDLVRWEEELREESVTYEQVTLEQLLADFPAVIKNAKSHVPRFVVLGPPGSGKSTLIQYLGWQAARQALLLSGRPLLPARVRLHEWEVGGTLESATTQGLASYLASAYQNLSPAPNMTQWHQWLQRGEVLLLLDGLDEIEGKPSFLSTLQTALRTYAECPALLTCRTVSFERHKTLCPEFSIFTLAGFDTKAQKRFITAFLAELPYPYDPQILLRQLSQVPQLHPLAANPLLLSIICYIVADSTEHILPTTRGALYEKALEKLLSRPTQRHDVRYPKEEPQSDEKLRIVQRAALHLFVRGERRLLFSSPELGQALKQALSEEGYGDAPAPWANALRVDLTLNSGIVRGNPDQGFFFLHLTVQEFLVAAALARIVNEYGWETLLEIAGTAVSIRRVLESKTWDPRWQEVISLFAGQLDDPGPLLKLLTAERKDDLFGSRLALAALCLPEMQAAHDRTHATIVDHITTAVVSRWLRHAQDSTVAAVPHLTHALPALGHVNGRMEGTPLLQWLKQRLSATNRDTRAGAAEALGQIGVAVAQYPDVLAALAVALQDPDVLVRSQATEAFRQIGEAAIQHPKVLPAIVQVALHDADILLRTGATRALHQMRAGEALQPEVRSALDTLLHDHDGEQRVLRVTEPDHTRSLLFQSLDTLVTLTAALHDKDRGKRAQAANTLGRMEEAAAQFSTVLSALVEAALHDADGGVRSQATEAVGRIGDKATQYPQTLSALVALLHDRDGGVRAQAAKALGRMGKAAMPHPDVIPELITALHDEDSYVRFQAAEALAQMSAQGVRFFRRWWGRIEGKSIEGLRNLGRTTWT